jgi:hypothetical protein
MSYQCTAGSSGPQCNDGPPRRRQMKAIEQLRTTGFIAEGDACIWREGGHLKKPCRFHGYLAHDREFSTSVHDRLNSPSNLDFVRRRLCANHRGSMEVQRVQRKRCGCRTYQSSWTKTYRCTITRIRPEHLTCQERVASVFEGLEQCSAPDGVCQLPGLIAAIT